MSEADKIAALVSALREAANAYEDLLQKYGQPHGWGQIWVQSWRELADKHGATSHG